MPHAVIEQAMGHQVGSQVERAYRRTDVLQMRRKLADAWAAFCSAPNTGKHQNVISLQGKVNDEEKDWQK